MSMGNDGEVFVLDMGDPIKILHLAEQVIRLSGFEPYRDIQIVETNIRPGEKLFEEILTKGEGISSTSHQRLFIAKQDRLDYTRIGIAMERLQRAIRMSDWRVALDTLREFVPEYTPGAHLLPPPTPIAVERNEIDSASNTQTTEIMTRPNIAPAPAQ
jgi:FlaA1/EpsC-like NDP-sugar epimerase